MIFTKMIFTILFVLLFSQNTLASNTVIDQEVMRWILTSLSIQNAQEENFEDLINEKYSLGLVENAWAKLKACRDAGNSLNLNLAAAEHYMYARYISSDDGDTNYRRLPDWYETIKQKATKLDLQNYIQSSGKPVSPVNIQVTNWGKKGIEHGLKDYKNRKGVDPSSKYDYIWQSIGFAAYIYYTKYPNQPSVCELEFTNVSSPKIRGLQTIH